MNIPSGTKKSFTGFAWPGLADQVLELEETGLVTRTFRRLDRTRQTAVIEAALDEAAKVGLSQVSIKRVAARAQVAIGSMYQYFGKRERLVEVVIELSRRYMEHVLALSAPYLENLPLKDALHAYVEGGCDWMTGQGSLMRFYAQAAYRGDPELGDRLVRPVASRMRAVIRALLKRAIERGEIRSDIDLDGVAGVVHTLTIVLGDYRLIPALDAYFQLQIAKSRPERTLEAALDMVMRGLTA